MAYHVGFGHASVWASVARQYASEVSSSTVVRQWLDRSDCGALHLGTYQKYASVVAAAVVLIALHRRVDTKVLISKATGWSRFVPLFY